MSSRLTNPYPVHLTSAERRALLGDTDDPDAVAQAHAKLRFLQDFEDSGRVDVHAGQVWAQPSKGILGGQWRDTFQIVDIVSDQGVQYARTFRQSTGRHARVRLDRFQPDRYGQSAYILVSEAADDAPAPAEPSWTASPIGDGDAFTGPHA